MKDKIIHKYYITVSDIESKEFVTEDDALEFAMRLKDYFDDIKVIQYNYKIVLSYDYKTDLSYLGKNVIYEINSSYEY